MEPNVWSISVVDQRGRLLADHNGNVPRVPASNQKLIATAFALDRLGPDFRLKTQLLRHGDGSLEMVGEGDPDLTVSEIQRFAMVALGQGDPNAIDVEPEWTDQAARQGGTTAQLVAQ